MYERFYGLSGDPFRLTPDQRFCWPHRSFQKAKAYLSYGVQRGEGFVLITGRAGTGKTTLVTDLIANAGPNLRVVRITCSPSEDAQLIHTLATAVDIEPEGMDRPALMRRLIQSFDENHRAGLQPLLVIDEAQALGEAALEELRFLTNLENDGQPLLQIFLLGQEWLTDVLRRPGLEQLHQRLIAASHLEPLDTGEVRAYIEHRLHCVGWDEDPAFADALYPAIRRLSGGIPRRVNHLAARLLMVGFIEEKHALGLGDLITVTEDLREEQLLPCTEAEAQQIVDELTVQLRGWGVKPGVTEEDEAPGPPAGPPQVLSAGPELEEEEGTIAAMGGWRRLGLAAFALLTLVGAAAYLVV